MLAKMERGKAGRPAKGNTARGGHNLLQWYKTHGLDKKRGDEMQRIGAIPTLAVERTLLPSRSVSVMAFFP